VAQLLNRTQQTYNVLWATMNQYVKQGLVSDSKVLDIRRVEVSQGKVLENDIPVFLVTFATQEVLCFRSAKTGDVVVGSPNAVEQCNYAAVLTLVESELDNPETGGWKIVEVCSLPVSSDDLS
jgi:import inner membrane translocase subunit TIM44